MLGTIVPFGEVSTKKDRAKSKAKDAASGALGDASSGRVSRGGRAGFAGGRGRGTDRGRGGRGRGGAVTGSHQENTESALPAAETTAWGASDNNVGDTPAKAVTTDNSWDTPSKAEDTSDAKPAEDSWGATAVASSVANTAVAATSSIIPNGVKKSWASIFAPAPAPTPKKAPEPVVEK